MEARIKVSVGVEITLKLDESHARALLEICTCDFDYVADSLSSVLSGDFGKGGMRRDGLIDFLKRVEKPLAKGLAELDEHRRMLDSAKADQE